jgi:hypothetical protein
VTDRNGHDGNAGTTVTRDSSHTGNAVTLSPRVTRSRVERGRGSPPRKDSFSRCSDFAA